MRCAVRSDAQFLAHRVKEVSKRLANWGGRRVEAAGGVKNMPGGVVDRWWDSASERRQNDVFLEVRREKCRWAAKKNARRIVAEGTSQT